MHPLEYEYRAFFDRQTHTNAGWFTIQRRHLKTGVVEILIDKMLVRSGATEFANTSWVRGKSPIPFSKEVNGGKYRLWLAPINKNMHVSVNGIGEFFPISTEDNRVTTLCSPKVQATKGGNLNRHYLGFHLDNDMVKNKNKGPVGSAGCVAAPEETPVQKALWVKASSLLKALGAHFKYIELMVV